MLPSPTDAENQVTVLGVPFPRLTQAEAVALLLERVRRGETTAACFPDMSTLNLAAQRPGFRRLLQRRVLTFNDGAGLSWAARRRGKPFPANLNGTDLCPLLLQGLPAGTRVYIVGGKAGVAARAQALLAGRFPALCFVGAHHGYLDAAGDRAVREELRRLRPQVVLVGMGNPLQVEWIDRHLDDPHLQGALWLAVGGQLDYYGGTLTRAPAWMRRARLEWLHIVRKQPYKARRYFEGIPLFLLRCLWDERGGAAR